MSHDFMLIKCLASETEKYVNENSNIVSSAVLKANNGDHVEKEGLSRG